MDRQSTSSIDTCERVPPDQLILDRLGEDRYTVDEILDEVPELSWAQLFLAIYSLSRRGMSNFAVGSLPTPSGG